MHKVPSIDDCLFVIQRLQLAVDMANNTFLTRSSTSDISLRVRCAAVRAAAQLAQVLADAVISCS